MAIGKKPVMEEFYLRWKLMITESDRNVGAAHGVGSSFGFLIDSVKIFGIGLDNLGL